MMGSLARDLLEGKKYPTDLIIILFWSIVTVIFVFILPDGNIIRIIFGIPLLIFIPGYALVSALWPETRRSQLTDLDDNFERVAMSFGLSIVLVALVALVLIYTIAGVTLATTTFANFSIICILSILAYYRRMQLPIEKRYSIILRFKSDNTETITDRIGIAIVITSLIISSCAIGYIVLAPTIGEKYSEFYILDFNGTTDNFPLNVSINETATVRIGIVCHEFGETNYTIVAGLENVTTNLYCDNWDRVFNITENIGFERSIRLSHESQFEEDFTLSIENTGKYKIVWQLYIDGNPSDYSLHIWVDVY